MAKTSSPLSGAHEPGIHYEILVSKEGEIRAYNRDLRVRERSAGYNNIRKRQPNQPKRSGINYETQTSSKAQAQPGTRQMANEENYMLIMDRNDPTLSTLRSQFGRQLPELVRQRAEIHSEIITFPVTGFLNVPFGNAMPACRDIGANTKAISRVPADARSCFTRMKRLTGPMHCQHRKSIMEHRAAMPHRA